MGPTTHTQAFFYRGAWHRVLPTRPADYILLTLEATVLQVVSVGTNNPHPGTILSRCLAPRVVNQACRLYSADPGGNGIASPAVTRPGSLEWRSEDGRRGPKDFILLTSDSTTVSFSYLKADQRQNILPKVLERPLCCHQLGEAGRESPKLGVDVCQVR